MRLIDADELIESMESLDWKALYMLMHFKELIEDCRTVEPKKGSWRSFSREEFIGIDDSGNKIYEPRKRYHCSNCNQSVLEIADYCPNCKSDMRKEK